MNKQIEIMASIIYDELDECMRIHGFGTCDFCKRRNDDKDCKFGHYLAEELYNAGYCNEKETAREILSWIEREAKPIYCNVDDNPRMESYILLSDIYKFIKEKFGIEVK